MPFRFWNILLKKKTESKNGEYIMKVIFYGIGGAMGKKFREIAESRNDVQIVCGIDKFPENCKYDFPVYSSCKNITENADCIIDFSMHSCIYDYLPFAINRNIPCVIASTGFNDQELEYIEKCSKIIPILKSGNMSLGINILLQLSKLCAKTLGDISDIEIVEQHHNRKTDAPSGTALLLADGIKEILPDSKYVLGRSGLSKREKGDIGISAVRGGTIVGKHEVMFIMENEVITLKHEAESRSVFAIGSINAAKYIVKQKPGLYSMENLFN